MSNDEETTPIREAVSAKSDDTLTLSISPTLSHLARRENERLARETLFRNMTNTGILLLRRKRKRKMEWWVVAGKSQR